MPALPPVSVVLPAYQAAATAQRPASTQPRTARRLAEGLTIFLSSPL